MEGWQEMEDAELRDTLHHQKPKKALRKSVKFVQTDRHLSIQMIAEKVNIDKEAIRLILHD
jgi:hypothetical protein